MLCLQVMVERQGGGRVWYTRQQIHACMEKVIAVDLGQTVQVSRKAAWGDYLCSSCPEDHASSCSMFFLQCVSAQYGAIHLLKHY
jgi:hypothetical protein